MSQDATGEEQVRRLWLALGFADVDADGRLTDADLDALRRLRALAAGADEEFTVGLARALGHHMSRLATWQVIALVQHMTDASRGAAEEGASRAVAYLTEHLDDLDQLVLYTWRRHIAAVTGWRLGRITQDARHFSLTVGFADMVAYTQLSQELDASELAELVARFESVCAGIVLRNSGRVVKTVGDEILFVTDTPEVGGSIALELAEAMADDRSLPQVRVGLASGEVISQLGDVFGPTVNTANRLTTLADPGTVLIDETTAAALHEMPAFVVVEQPARSIPGTGDLTPSQLRRT